MINDRNVNQQLNIRSYAKSIFCSFLSKYILINHGNRSDTCSNPFVGLYYLQLVCCQSGGKVLFVGGKTVAGRQAPCLCRGREASRRRAPPPNSYSQSMTMSSTGTATTTASHRNDRGITTSSSTTISISAALTKECLQRHFPGRRYTNEAVELSSEFLKLFIIEARRRAAIEVRDHTCSYLMWRIMIFVILFLQ